MPRHFYIGERVTAVDAYTGYEYAAEVVGQNMAATQVIDCATRTITAWQDSDRLTHDVGAQDA